MGRHRLHVALIAMAIAMALGGSVASAAARGSSAHNPSLTRYSLVNGCYALQSPAGGGPLASTEGPFRMQAAALGTYLLYGRRGDYLSAVAGRLSGQPAASTAAEWRVGGAPRPGFSITNLGNGMHLAVGFVAASGCASYPEASVSATGSPAPGASPEAGVLGTVEGHAHVTAFEFLGGDWHCGRPWSPFGVAYALPASCAQNEQGVNGSFQTLLDFGGATRPSDFHGWPTFHGWPSPTALAEEGDYYTGIERAWKAGLRVFVTQLVDNEVLCSLMTVKHNPCNDMAAVGIQSRDLYALQDYIDAQSGGPGRGWFRVVTDPFQARRVINQGKLAVIEGIEVSRIFGCGEVNGNPQCDTAQIDAGLRAVRALGVRTFFPVHEFDNAFGGTKMIGGSTGAIVNLGNRDETGSFWTLQPCAARDQDAEQFTIPAGGPLAQLLNGPLSSLLHGNPLPVYPTGPQCNTRGLTSLGAYVIKQMIAQHFVIQTDHMSSKTASAAISIAEASHYSGVVSAHCCSSPQLFKRIYDIGGIVNPPVEPAAAFVSSWKADRAVQDPRYHFGFGWGSDENGLGSQPGPAETKITYPFRSYDGRVTFSREQWGQRTFDLNTDGLANYGMYADWLNNLQAVGGRPLMNDMFQGAEAYLQMWERTDGVRPAACRPARERFTNRGLAATLRLGDSTRGALYRAGQPQSRPGRSYRYCVNGGGAIVRAVFNQRGQVGMIVSNAPGSIAGAVGVGALTRRLSGAHRVLSGVWVGRRLARGARYLYGVRSGRVRYAGITSAAELRRASRLRSDLRAAGL